MSKPMAASTNRGSSKRGTIPPLPSSVPSQLGPVPVVMVDEGDVPRKKRAMGRWRMDTRHIEISVRSSPAAQWQTLWHERIHMILCDAGLHNAFTAEQQEVIADVIGTALAADSLGKRA